MDNKDSNKSVLLQLFLVFAKVGAFTIGGGYAMIMIIKDELIKRGWISEEEFPDILAIAQTAPGIIAVNFAIFAGYRICGIKGAVTATIGSCLPSFLTILIIAIFFRNFQDNPVVIRIFKGIRPAVVALIAVPTIKMAMSNDHKWWKWAASAVSLCLVAFMKVSPAYVILITIAISFSISKYSGHKGKGGAE